VHEAGLEAGPDPDVHREIGRDGPRRRTYGRVRRGTAVGCRPDVGDIGVGQHRVTYTRTTCSGARDVPAREAAGGPRCRTSLHSRRLPRPSVSVAIVTNAGSAEGLRMACRTSRSIHVDRSAAPRAPCFLTPSRRPTKFP
jgi:hypothetical protein